MTALPSAVAALKPIDTRQSLVRVCNLDDPRVTVEKLAISPAQKNILYAGAGYSRKPTDRQIIQRHIESVFTRSLIGREDRYSKLNHALYASVKRATAEAEIRYYCRSQFFNPALSRETLSFDIIDIEFHGLAARLSSLFRRYPWLKARTALVDTQEIGDLAAAFLGCLFVRSVRYAGDNGVVYRASDLKPVKKNEILRINVIKRSTGRFTRKL